MLTIALHLPGRLALTAKQDSADRLVLHPLGWASVKIVLSRSLNQASRPAGRSEKVDGLSAGPVSSHCSGSGYLCPRPRNRL